MSTRRISLCGSRAVSAAATDPAAVRPRVGGRLLVAAAVAAAIGAPTASASQLIDRGATDVRLHVNQGQALLVYRAHGAERRVLAWGAVNARPPSTTVPQ